MRYKLERRHKGNPVYSFVFRSKINLIRELDYHISSMGIKDTIIITAIDQVDLPVPVEVMHEEIPYVLAE